MNSIDTTAVNFEPVQDKDTQTEPLTPKQTAKFWTVTQGKGPAKVTPCWDCIRTELIEMGFRTYWPEGIDVGAPEFVRVTENILDPFDSKGILNNFVRTHIEPMKGPQIIEIEGGDTLTFPAEQLRESFLRVQGNNFAPSQLYSLPPLENEILKDTRTSAFFMFRNKIVEVTAGRRRELDYKDLGSRCVWRSRIMKRDFTQPRDNKQSHFEQFLLNVTNGIPARMAAFTSAIGYILHNYTPQSEAKAVWLTDEQTADKDAPEGRTGKGTIAKAIKELRSQYYRNGKAYKPNSEFFFGGVTRATQVIYLDDPNELFNFESLFSVLTEGWTVQRKHREDLSIPAEESPKLLIAANSNYQPNLRGNSNKDRLHILTLSNFYSSRLTEGTGRPIIDVHGGEFYTDWDPDEWARFYSFMLTCVSYYLKNRLQPYACPSLIANQLIRQTSREFVEWVNDPELDDGGSLDDGIERKASDLFTNYKAASGDDKQTQRTFNRWLGLYAEICGLQMKKRKGNGTQYFTFIKKC